MAHRVVGHMHAHMTCACTCAYVCMSVFLAADALQAPSEASAKAAWLARRAADDAARDRSVRPTRYAVGDGATRDAAPSLLEQFRRRCDEFAAPPPVRVPLSFNGVVLEVELDAGATTDDLCAEAARLHDLEAGRVALSWRGVRLPSGVPLAETWLAGWAKLRAPPRESRASERAQGEAVLVVAAPLEPPLPPPERAAPSVLEVYGISEDPEERRRNMGDARRNNITITYLPQV